MINVGAHFPFELELVQEFARKVSRFPVASLSPNAVGALVIAHELSLPKAGSGGGDGSLDLLLIDDCGEVWVIEAKLARSSESDPEFVFANQLMRYGQALATTTLTELHRHFQDFVYGRRAVKPRAELLEHLQSARTLTDMIRLWLQALGEKRKCTLSASDIIQRIDARLRSGNFILSVLTDDPRRAQLEWIRNNSANFQLALVSVDRDTGIQVHARTAAQEQSVAVGSAAVDLPPFLRIPQSFRPTPNTLRRVLNDAAWRVFDDAFSPRMREAIGEAAFQSPNASVQSSSSFGYVLPMSNGLPVFLRIGRGDKGVAGSQWSPGAHTLQVNVNLIWAVHELRHWSGDDTHRVKLEKEIWELCARLIGECGYRIKGAPSDSRTTKEFENFYRSRLKRTDELILERARPDRSKDFGNSDAEVAEDCEVVHRVLDIVFACCPAARPLRPIQRMSRSMKTSAH